MPKGRRGARTQAEKREAYRRADRYISSRIHEIIELYDPETAAELLQLLRSDVNMSVFFERMPERVREAVDRLWDRDRPRAPPPERQRPAPPPPPPRGIVRRTLTAARRSLEVLGAAQVGRFLLTAWRRLRGGGR